MKPYYRPTKCQPSSEKPSHHHRAPSLCHQHPREDPAVLSLSSFQLPASLMTRLSPLHHSLLVLLLTSWMSFSSAIFQPSCGGSSRSSSLTKHSLFGVLPPNNEALFVRGGEVLTPETLEDVEAIVMKAGSENKLVIIDFYAEVSRCHCRRLLACYQHLS